MYGGNNGTPMFPVFLDENQLQYDSNACTTQLQLFGSIPPACNVDPANYIRPSKRSRDAEDTGTQHKLQISLNNFYQDETDRSAGIPNPNPVSTGLRLSYDDDEHNSSITTASVPSLGDTIRSEIERQKEEFDHYIRIQEEQFVKGVRELRQRHVASFLGAVDRGVGRKVREKEAEIESVGRRNRELGERIRQAGAEAQSWQCRARYNESVVHALQNSLKQAVATARGGEQGREGCGDSEVDDATSACEGRQGRVVGCRVCGGREACMLVLPCRHLCACKECDGLVDACPVCLAVKTASVEVYMP